MELDCYNCPICTTEYNHEQNEPRIIPNCGHSVCLKCLIHILKDFSSTFKCPLCARAFPIRMISAESFPKNYLALNLIDKRNKSNLCSHHSSIKDLVCFDCKETICNKCAFKGNHRNHQIDMLEDFINDLNNQTSDLKKWVETLDDQIMKVDNFIEVQRKNLILMVDLTYRIAFENLRKRKKNLLNEINKQFNEIENIQFINTESNQNQMRYSLSSLKEVRNNLFSKLEIWNKNNDLNIGFDLQNQKAQAFIKDIKTCLEDNPFEDIKSKIRAYSIKIMQQDTTSFKEVYNFAEMQEESIRESIQKMIIQSWSVIKQDDTLILSQPFETESIECSHVTLNNINDITNIALELSKLNFDEDKANQIYWLLNQAPNVRKIKLNMAGSKVSKIAFDKVFIALGALLDLECIELNFQECTSVEDATNVKSVYALRSLSSLREFHLNVSNTQISSISLNQLLDCLNFTTKLESVTICMSECPNLDDRVCQSLKSSLSQQRKLSNFNLDISRCHNITDEMMEELSVMIKEKNFLCKLKISFASSPKISDKGIKWLSKSIEYLGRLHSLTLNLAECNQMADQGIIHLSEAVSNLPVLQNLDLNFKGLSSLKDETLHFLCNSISTLEKLESLNLNLSDCKLLTNHSLLKLRQTIQFDKLKALSLNLAACKNVDDNGMGPLFGSIIESKSLQEINLDIAQCYRIRGNFFDQCYSTGTESNILRGMRLNLTECTQISQKNFERLLKGLASSRFERMDLVLKSCPEIKDPCFECLEAFLHSENNLKKLKINMDCCNNITNKGVSRLNQILAEYENTNRNLSIEVSLQDCPGLLLT